MPNPALAASSAVFSGAQQGQDASDFYSKQLQAQQLDALLKRQALLGQLQQMQQQQSALAAAPKEEQQFLNLGGSVTDWQKRQDLGTQADALSDQMYQGAMDTTKTPQERMDLFQKAAQLRQHPELVQLPQFQKYGSTTKVPKEWEFVDKDTGAPIIYNGGPIPPNAVTAGAYGASQKAQDKPVRYHYYERPDNATGMPMTWERIEDSAGNLISDKAVAPGKLGAMQQQQVQAVSVSEQLAQGLDKDYAAIKPKYDKGGAVWLLNQWRLYNPTTNPGGYFGEPDPDAAAWFSHVGQMKSGLLQAAGGNSRNLKMVNDLFGPHVPSEWQSPDGVMNRIKAFQRDGRFDAIRNSILPPMPSAAPSGDTSVGWSPDGREVMERPDGSKYLK